MLISFEEALNRAAEGKKKHVFLENGLAELAAMTSLPTMALRKSALLTELYLPTNPQLAARFQSDADALRSVLAAAIAQNHPERPADIAPERYRACRRFLDNFDSVYTLNYDLLLYWTIMQTESEQPLRLGDERFRTPDDRAADYVSWDVEKTDRQDVFFLHGALHLYDAGDELKKFT
ncbi:MAG: hypothetical protein JWO13_3600 [Acidobacteriales bacterium]|nr:hypothetical protein [Terriglobales bacterium]